MYLSFPQWSLILRRTGASWTSICIHWSSPGRSIAARRRGWFTDSLWFKRFSTITVFSYPFFKSTQEEGKLKEKKPVVLKASLSKPSSSIIGECDSRGESPNDEDMVLLVKQFNCYIKNHGLRRSDKNSLSSRKSQTKGETSKDENGWSCFGWRKLGHLRREFLRQNP